MGTRQTSLPLHTTVAATATHAVLLTPPGRGAIATVLVDGPQATDCVARWFRAANGRPLVEQPLEQIVFGRWGTELDAKPGEELVVCRRSEQRVEIHCHGGRAAAAAILEALVEAGCSRCHWADWLAAIGTDPLEVAARRALAAATTRRAASILLDQFHGALRAAIDRVVSLIDARDVEAAIGELVALLRYADLGLHLTRSWRVVLAGRPNVGKSSLINALVGYERAIVFDQPGTTRDVVTATTAIDGWPIELADTAGLRPQADAARLRSHATQTDRRPLADAPPDDDDSDQLESAGMALAGDRMQSADLVIWVTDAAAQRSENSGGESFEQHHPDSALLVVNKIDLLSGNLQSSFEARSDADVHSTVHLPDGAILTSATLGTGIDELARAIAARLVPAVPSPGAAVPFTSEQVTALARALSELQGGNTPTARDDLCRLC